MKTLWVDGLDGQAEIDLRVNFLASQLTRKRLAYILENKNAASEKASLAKDLYNSPNWAYLQADVTGYKRALQEVLSLLI